MHAQYAKPLRDRKIMQGVVQDNTVTALALIASFEKNEGNLRPQDAEKLVAKIFAACGYDVTETGFFGREREVDCFISGMIDGKHQTIAIEVKSGNRPADIRSVQQAFALKNNSPRFDRAMVISRAGFSTRTLREAETLGLGEIDLLSPGALRDWLAKQAAPPEITESREQIVRTAMQKLADLVANSPEALTTLKWWEVEAVLREAFEGMGFGTKLTRPSKDGGFDLELTINESGKKRVFLVEVKHWTDQRPGSKHLKKLIKVTLSQSVEGSFLLSSSGFTKTIYSGITEISTPVRLGSRNKIVALCRTYYRLKNQLWYEDMNLHRELIAGTWGIKAPPIVGTT
ncbi:hypothetical protein GR253_29530 [Rhizobium leguminosarum]|nr:hypothetical protein [Rhizobium leguminosarum]